MAIIFRAEAEFFIDFKETVTCFCRSIYSPMQLVNYNYLSYNYLLAPALVHSFSLLLLFFYICSYDSQERFQIFPRENTGWSRDKSF